MRTNLKAIVAMSENRAIGKNNKLPWGRIAGDLPRFKRLTEGNVIVMGRKTFESIGGVALPHRTNLVLTRNNDRHCTNTFTSVESLLQTLQALKLHKVFVIGGAEIYKLLLPYCDELYLTLVKGQYEGDTFMPEFEKDFPSYFAEEYNEQREFRRYFRNAPQNLIGT